jgi:hypothetical protein
MVSREQFLPLPQISPVDTIDHTFAVVQSDDAELDQVAVARWLSDPLDCPVADLVRLLSTRSGIFAEGLDERVAQQCARELRINGVAAQVVANETLVDPPEPTALRSAVLDEAALQYMTQPQRGAGVAGLVRWPDVLWINCVSIQQVSTEEVEDWEINREGERARVQRFKTRRMKTTRPLQIDLVTREPWAWWQIHEDKFEFATTGLTVQPNRRLNMFTVAIGLSLRAPGAVQGPGLSWLAERTPPCEQRLPNAALHVSQLRWHLTRLSWEQNSA